MLVFEVSAGCTTSVALPSAVELVVLLVFEVPAGGTPFGVPPLTAGLGVPPILKRSLAMRFFGWLPLSAVLVFKVFTGGIFVALPSVVELVVLLVFEVPAGGTSFGVPPLTAGLGVPPILKCSLAMRFSVGYHCQPCWCLRCSLAARCSLCYHR